ncbi:MAG: nucleoside triphosphate pyrophosphohydrolase [Deltaproteobacteria bacterium]|nr:nucleoside triphosphate pyrophosphohydrolase [Deltaproteobacteria bacterium]
MSTSAALFQRLLEVIAKLRDPKDGCPWDLQQTHESLKPYLIEEAYETIDAIDKGKHDKNYAKLCEELGDVLLQVVLHSQVAKDNKEFSIDDVVKGLTEKLVHRHPHVFGDTKVSSAQEVTQNWERLKAKEQPSAHILAGLPKSMPALLKCHRIGEKVGRIGFDWPDSKEVRDKVREELNEFLEADDKAQRDAAHVKEELGDLLFTLAQLARKMGLNAEDVLIEANDKFCGRFAQIEALGEYRLSEKTPEELENYWQQVKAKEKAATKKTQPK